MRRKLIAAVALGFVTLGGLQLNARQMSPAMKPTDKGMVDQHISAWKAKPKEAAMMLMKKYGPPHEATAHRLIWHNNGPWKVTELVNEEIPHDFPVPHVDFLYQGIDHKIEPSDADELLEYDGSVILERTKGMIAARCDKEEPNFLAINLAHDIINNKKSVDAARKFYAESMMAFMKTMKPNDYQRGFLFPVAKSPQGDKDKPASIPMK